VGYCIIIPARFASTRFPGKPLADIGGKTMIRRVWDCAMLCKDAEAVVVATDDKRIFEHVIEFGRAILTSAEHPSGTDRCNEAYQLAGLASKIVVNIQGDEPFIQPAQVQALVEMFSNEKVEIATLKKSISRILRLTIPI
jgi:3-deoxy-manno-octulosonate cytidylyltransferase (CMP-KDO synthetase)